MAGIVIYASAATNAQALRDDLNNAISMLLRTFNIPTNNIKQPLQIKMMAGLLSCPILLFISQ